MGLNLFFTRVSAAPTGALGPLKVEALDLHLPRGLPPPPPSLPPPPSSLDLRILHHPGIKSSSSGHATASCQGRMNGEEEEEEEEEEES